MSEVICPNCKTPFTIDENSYADIVRQIRDAEFSQELDKRVAQALDQKAAEYRAERAEDERRNEAQRAAAEKQSAATLAAAEKKAAEELAQLKDVARKGLDQLKDEKAKLETELALLRGQLDSVRKEAESEGKAELMAAHGEINQLKQQLEAQAHQADVDKRLALAEAKEQADQAFRAVEQRANAAEKQLEFEKKSADAQLALVKSDADKQLALQASDLAAQLQVKQKEIEERDRSIEDLRKMRREISMKLLGENLEQYCENEFNKLRPVAFQRAQFGKDNDASSGSKGDYIYREFDESGVEILSIMFEMKTEADESADKNRKRNSDHFAKLDRDRRTKKCEYAVLVSELETDNDLYVGITDVSYQSGFEKMYVVRPNSFISMITLLRNAAFASLGVRRELEAVRQRDLDVTHFEEQLDDFKLKFGASCRKANDNFQKAIKDIDDTIRKLENIREALRKSGGHLDAAENKLEKMTRGSLCRKNETVKAAFKEADERKAAGLVEPYVPMPVEDDDDEYEIIEAELCED